MALAWRIRINPRTHDIRYSSCWDEKIPSEAKTLRKDSNRIFERIAKPIMKERYSTACRLAWGRQSLGRRECRDPFTRRMKTLGPKFLSAANLKNEFYSSNGGRRVDLMFRGWNKWLRKGNDSQRIGRMPHNINCLLKVCISILLGYHHSELIK